MLRYLALTFACLLGCNSSPGHQAPDAGPTTAGTPSTAGTVALPADQPCDLSTQLVPGIPGSPGHLIASPRNPNGASELSMLMRAFVDDLNTARTQLEAGKPVKPLHAGHRKIRCAWPTKLEERNEAFDERARAYLGFVQAFDAKPSKDTYNAIIASCIACHAQSCGGPIEYIGGMAWQ